MMMMEMMMETMMMMMCDDDMMMMYDDDDYRNLRRGMMSLLHIYPSIHHPATYTHPSIILQHAWWWIPIAGSQDGTDARCRGKDR